MNHKASLSALRAAVDVRIGHQQSSSAEPLSIKCGSLLPCPEER